MPAKAVSGFSLKLAGPGVSFERPISEEIASRIINLVMTGSPTSPSLSPGGGAGALPGGAASAQGTGQLAGTTIKQFIAQKRPENLYQRVACLAYYLTHASNTPHFKTKDILKPILMRLSRSSPTPQSSSTTQQPSTVIYLLLAAVINKLLHLEKKWLRRCPIEKRPNSCTMTISHVAARRLRKSQSD
jgi:hypothetical protein